MASTLLPLQPGTYTLDPAGQNITAADLGNVYDALKHRYRLVKASALLTNPQSGLLVTALTAGAPTWVVSSTTTANDSTVVGVCPPTINGATTGTIPSGAFFLVVVEGYTTIVSSAAIVLGQFLVSSTTAYAAGPVSSTGNDGALQGTIGWATQAAAGAAVLTGAHISLV